MEKVQLARIPHRQQQQQPYLIFRNALMRMFLVPCVVVQMVLDLAGVVNLLRFEAMVGQMSVPKVDLELLSHRDDHLILNLVPLKVVEQVRLYPIEATVDQTTVRRQELKVLVVRQRNGVLVLEMVFLLGMIRQLMDSPETLLGLVQRLKKLEMQEQKDLDHLRNLHHLVKNPNMCHLSSVTSR